MPKITSRRHKVQYVDIERALIRDKSLKSTSKLLYCLFVSIAESNDGNVFPSYSWLAEEVGYEYTPNVEHDDPIKAEENKERAMKKFIMSHLQPLIDRGLIEQTMNYSTTPDYEIVGYIDEREGTKKFTQSEQKSSYQSEQKSSLSNKSIRNKSIDTPISPTGDSVKNDQYGETPNPQKSYPYSQSKQKTQDQDTQQRYVIVPMSYPDRESYNAAVTELTLEGYRVIEEKITQACLEKWGEVKKPEQSEDAMKKAYDALPESMKKRVNLSPPPEEDPPEKQLFSTQESQINQVITV